MKHEKCRKGLSFLLVVALVLGLLVVPFVEDAYADGPDPLEGAVTNAINNYYNGTQDKVLDDWEELAAIYSYLEGQPSNSYSGGVDISDYVLPATGTGAAGLFAALMKGDAIIARELAESLVSEGQVVSAPSVSTYAMQVLALEAYNRSSGVTAIPYSTTGAIDYLLDAQDESGGYMAWGSTSFDDSGLALAALSLPAFSGYPGIDTEKTNLIDWLKEGQSPSGAFAAFGSDSANSTACVLYGLVASGDTLATWTTNPAMGLLDSGIYSDEQGWYTSWSGVWDAYSTKQATLALVDVKKGNSFYANLELNQTHYISTSMQMVKPDSSYVEKQVTVPTGSSLDFVAGKVSGSAISGGFSYYEEGITVERVEDGSAVLAVAEGFDYVTYFSYGGSGVGVPKINIAFGASVEFSVKNLELSTGAITSLPNASVDWNGDSYGDFVTDGLGLVEITPIEATTDLSILPTTWDDSTYTYIQVVPSDSAILPAEIRMASGGTQVKTVSVRVEGPTDNVAYYSAYDVVGDGTKQLTAGDAVTQVLSTAGVSYTYSGGYLSQIDGVTAGSYDPSFYDGWVYFMNGVAGSGLGSQIIQDEDEIIVYYGYYPGWGTDLVSMQAEVSGSGVTLTLLSGSIPVSDVRVSWDGVDLPSVTNVLGQVTIEGVSPGAYIVQISKTDVHGVPQVVRFASGTAITITDTGESSQEDGAGLTVTAQEVFLTVKGLRGQTLYSRTGQPYYVGITARDVLDNTSLSVSGTRAYVTGINGLNEFDNGENSGWLFTVNGGVAGTTGANSYRLSIGDEVLWYYTSDYTQDPGSSAWKAQNQGDTTSFEAVVKGNKATLDLKKEDLDRIQKEGGGFQMESSLVRLTLDQETVAGLLKQGIKDLEVIAEKVDGDMTLTQEQQALIGNRPVLNLTIRSGGTVFSSFQGKVTITFAYELKEGETPEEMLVYFLKEDGTLEGVRSTSYDETTGEWTFSVNHFSKYGIGHTPTAFGDIIDHWARPWISYLSTRQIVSGVTADSFLPNRSLTRAEFARILMGLEGQEESKVRDDGERLWPFEDGDGDAWYGTALLWGYEKGLFQGSPSTEGGLRIQPQEPLTRQDMAVLLLRYKEMKGDSFEPGIGQATTFADESQISDYAKEAVNKLAAAEILKGKGEERFDPKGTTTRGEAAKVMALILKKELE
jgi:hypothetical protein